MGRLGDWTVAAMDLAIDQWPTEAASRLSKRTGEVVLGAMDLGDAVGVAAADKGKLYPLMWSAGWRRPTNPVMDRRARVAWEDAANTLAKKAGLRTVGKALGALRNPGDGRRESLDRLVTEAMQLLDIPAELRGVHSADLGPLTDVVGR